MLSIEKYYNGSRADEIIKDVGALLIVLFCLILIGRGVDGYVTALCTFAVGYYFRKRFEVKDGK